MERNHEVGHCSCCDRGIHFARDLCRAATTDWKQSFQKVSDEYFDEAYFYYAPSAATQVGFHQFDAQLESFSRKSIDAEIATLKNFEQRIEAIHPNDSVADSVPRSDREIVLASIRSQLLTLETIRPWRRTRTTIQAPARAAPLS